MITCLIVNEAHPKEQPGAATIAWDFACELSKTVNTFFLYTSLEKTIKQQTPVENLGKPNLLTIKRRSINLPSGYSGELLRIIIDLFDIFFAIRFLKLVKHLSPDVIWVHAIGNHIPRIIFPILSRKYRVIHTTHDFGLIVPRKLYPKDLSNKILQTLNIAGHNTNFRLTWHLKRLPNLFFYYFRRLILRLFLKNVRLVCISSLQSDIYRHFGFTVKRVIPNGIDLCRCDARSIHLQQFEILFVGRLIGKGFSKLLISSSESNVNLALVGSTELLVTCKTFKKPLEYEYFGRLDRSEVFKIIHNTKLVYVVSDCFDVYPTIAIEAIRHGAFPIVSDTTGVREIVRRIDSTLVNSSQSKTVELEEILKKITDNSSDMKEKLKIANQELLTVVQSLKEYDNLLELTEF